MDEEEQPQSLLADEDVLNQWSCPLAPNLKPELWVGEKSSENEHACVLRQVWRGFCLHQKQCLAFQDCVATEDSFTFGKMFGVREGMFSL
jgi:hypothetical protein